MFRSFGDLKYLYFKPMLETFINKLSSYLNLISHKILIFITLYLSFLCRYDYLLLYM